MDKVDILLAPNSGYKKFLLPIAYLEQRLRPDACQKALPFDGDSFLAYNRAVEKHAR